MKSISILILSVFFSLCLPAMADFLGLTEDVPANTPRTVKTRNDFENLLTGNNAINRVFDDDGNLVQAQVNHLGFDPDANQMPGIAAFVPHN